MDDDFNGEDIGGDFADFDYRLQQIELAQINAHNNGNFKTVKVKKSRDCKLCHKPIEKGTKATTINPKLGNRYWVCEECIWASSSLKQFIDNGVIV